MRVCKMQKGSVASIETFGLVDGPGIRTVIFINSCNLRCKYCHNPEMWKMGSLNYSSSEIVEKVLRNKPYFKNGGGVTFSGGEPLLQYDFLLETCQKLKKENINIALDTAGIANCNYQKLFKYIDLVLLDIKHINKEDYINITGKDFFNQFMQFIKELNKTDIEVWIRQVIIPDVNDNLEYIKKLSDFIKENIKNVTRIDFLPYHKLGDEKYKNLKIVNPYKDKVEMNKEKCNKLYNEFLNFYKL